MSATSDRTILHTLSQRPSLTGSGVTLDALVHEAHRAGWQQHVVVATPADDPLPKVATLPPDQIHPVVFDRPPLDFPVPGMSDVMPYRSTRFSAMTPGQLDEYRGAWKRHLTQTLRQSRPALIHSHHVWILGAMLKDVAPDLPVVTQCHATGFRQMDLCPRLADEVRRGCARNDRFLVLHRGHARELSDRLGVPAERIHVVGAGYRPDLFHTRGRAAPGNRLVYAGKFSASKGVPWLLDAFDRLKARRPQLELHVAGAGSGAEAESLGRRMESMAGVVVHGRLGQAELAGLLRTASVFVLPSLYEGVPLVLVEAAACGCRLVATDLPGVREELAPVLGEALELVALPRLRGVDVPEPADLPGFVDGLAEAIEASLGRAGVASSRDSISALEDRFSWAAVFRRVEGVWRLALTWPRRAARR